MAERRSFPALVIRHWDATMLTIAIGVLAWLFYEHTMLASRVVEGTRYFWLDDDMMISMRYGRNLAEGHGLVWNPGERVEGYTNFLWTLVMAAVHCTGVADARAAVLVRLVDFGLLAGSLVLAVRLLRLFAPHSRSAAPVLLLLLVTCPDVLLWPAWGFENGLLMFLSLLFLVRILGRGNDALGFAALALIPLTRGDGLYVFAFHALLALLVVQQRRKTLFFIAIACAPALAHLLFRRSYYGDWLPNTYYLKVFGLDDAHRRGFLYARGFLLTYAVVLALAAGSAVAILRTDRRGLVPFVLVLPTLGYVMLTGGDMYGFFRFFAHVMPVVLVFATLGIVTVAHGTVGRLVWIVVLCLVSVPLVDPQKRLLFRALNGDPERQVEVAVLVAKNALPDSSIAVFCAGIVPYFARRRAIDMLGKSDRHIARLMPYPGAMVGHGKVDPAYTFGLNPDLVVTCSTGIGLPPTLPVGQRAADPMITLVASEAFQTRYLRAPIVEPFLMQETAIYTHAGSPELPRRTWRSVTVGPRP